MAERIPLAFLAGLVSIAFPCVLPLVPGYLSAVSAVEVGRLGERGVARRVVIASVPFAIGFTVVFVVLGAGAAAVGGALSHDRQAEVAGFVLIGIAFTHAMSAFRWVRDHYTWIRVASGLTLVVLGLLLFFHRDWWLNVLLHRALEAIGLGQL